MNKMEEEKTGEKAEQEEKKEAQETEGSGEEVAEVPSDEAGESAGEASDTGAGKQEPLDQAPEESPEEPASVNESPVPEGLADDQPEKAEKEEVKPPFEDMEVARGSSEEDSSPEGPEEKKEEDSERDSSSESQAGEAGPGEKEESSSSIFALRTTANREDQVMDFITSNIEKKKELNVYSVIRPHGMRGYIFIEAATKADAEQAAHNIPYARGLLPNPVDYSEMEHMLEQVKHEVDIRKNDIAEIIAGPFKRENAKVTRVDKTKEEVVVELLEAAVPIPITVKMDAIKVIRREGEEEGSEV